MFLVPSCAKGAPRLCCLLGPLHLHAAPGRRDSARSALTAATEGACHGSVSATPWSLRSPGAPGEGQPCRAGAVPTVDPAFSALTGGAGRGDGAGRPPRDPSLSPRGQARPGCARTRAQCRAPAPRSHRLRLGPSSPSQQDFDVNRTRANKQSLWPPVSASPDLMATPPVPPGPGLWVPGSVSHSLHRPRASVQALSPVSRGEGGGPPASGRCCLSFKGKMFVRSRGRPLIEASLSEGVCSEVGVRPPPPAKGPV